jgi:hypothetical protein
MLVTILLYSFFTGLSALSVGVWDFAFYRFLTGLGVGGEFAVAADEHQGLDAVRDDLDVPDHDLVSALGKPHPLLDEHQSVAG